MPHGEEHDAAVEVLRTIKPCLVKAQPNIAPNTAECTELDRALRLFQPVGDVNDMLADFNAFIRKALR